MAQKMDLIFARMFNKIYTENVGEGQIQVEAKIDSKTLFNSVHSSKQVDEKIVCHLVAWIKQQLSKGLVSKIDLVNSNQQLADVFA